MRFSKASSDRGSALTLTTRDVASPEAVDPDATGLLRPVTRIDRSSLGQGSAIGRFLVLEKLGEGGMGVVYAAYDPALNRRVALKLLLVEGTTEDDGEARSRLVREAQALAALSHPSVVAVYEVGEHEGDVFIAMEYVDGQTLRDWLKVQPRPWREVLGVCIEAGRGLAAAHAAGLVHRDFKPANVLVGNDGRVRVMDFGLARASSSGETEGGPAIAANSTNHSTGLEDVSAALLKANVTRYGVVLGTPAYMAPEQRKGEEADAHSDQYSYCVSLFEALYGQKPEREHAAATPAPRGSNVPAWVHRVIERGLQEAPEQRFASMETLLQALLADPSARRRKVLGAAAGVLLLPATAAGAVTWQQQQRQLCKGVEAKLAGVWDEGRSAQVEAAMLGTGAAFAGDMWSYVQPRLDDYARAWAEQHTQTCEATNLRGEQSAEVLDLRMACLHRAKVKLNATTDLLASADATTVQKAADVVDGLERLSRCSDVEGLRADVQPPAPEDAQTVERVRASLAQTSALRTAARYAEAEAALHEAEVLLSSIDYGPLQTELALERGQLLWRGRGDYEASEAALREALRLGARWHQWHAVRDAAIVLLNVVGNHQARPQEALHYLELANGLVEGQDDALAQALLHNNLGNILVRQGNAIGAEAEHRRALELRSSALGSDHPLVAQSVANVAAMLYFLGKYRDAEIEFRRALGLLREAFGPEHPILALALQGLGTLLVSEGRYEEATATLQQALVLNERVLGPEHPGLIPALTNLGVALWSQGRHEEAEVAHRRTLVLAEKALGPGHPETAIVIHNIGLSLWSQARYEDAEVELRRSLALFEANSGAEHPESAESRHWLAEVLLAQHRTGEALRAAELVWVVRQKEGTPLEHQAQTAFVLARALWETGADKHRARALAERAVEAYAQAGELHAAKKSEVEAWLQQRHPRSR